MNATARHLTMAELEAGLDIIRQAPRTNGRLEMIVRRPRVSEREVIEVGQISLQEGLVGDNWKDRSSSRTPDKTPFVDMQLTIMNARVISLLAQDKVRWQLAGDQLFVDFDLSTENIPPGTQIAIGEAIVQVSAEPHTGCKKFHERFGNDALKFVNSPEGRKLQLRGINAKVIQAGVVRVGDPVIRR